MRNWSSNNHHGKRTVNRILILTIEKEIKGRRQSVPRRLKCQYVVNVYNIYIKKSHQKRWLIQQQPTPAPPTHPTQPLLRPNAAWALENSLVHLKTHIINILSFY